MRLFALLALIVSGAAFTIAQERPIDKAEFEAAVNGTDAHKIKWAGQSYRIDVTTSAKILNRPESDYSSKMIIEFGLPPSVRTSTTSTFGGKSTLRETLVLGDSLYSRENGGPWTVAPKRATASADDVKADSAPRSTVSSDVTYFLVGKDRFRGATATVFRTVEKIREMDASNGSESESVHANIYWIVDGIQRRHELRSQNRYPKFESANVITTEWNLDPAITFAAPQVAAPKQDPPR